MEKSFKFAGRRAALLLACPGALTAAFASPAGGGPDFATARTQFEAGRAGASAATAQAQQLFSRLLSADADNPLYLAYYGNTFALQARDTRVPWTRIKLINRGTTLLDRALALLEHAQGGARLKTATAPAPLAGPAVLATRLVPMATFIALPETLFHRLGAAKRENQRAVTSPEFAAAASDLQGHLQFEGALIARPEGCAAALAPPRPGQSTAGLACASPARCAVTDYHWNAVKPQQLRPIIEAAYEKRQTTTPANVDMATAAAVEEAIRLLDCGELRVAEPLNGQWQVNEWLKKAVLLYFRTHDNRVHDAGYTRFYDKVPLKHATTSPEEFAAAGVRVVPHAIVRRGAYVAPNTVLMPSYVNIGAYVDSGTMVDTWVTVGSCVQIGKNVHLSGGVGIGGVLEPLQASPTIIEDNCFIGARSEIVEGVIVGEGSVISMGVFIGQSTRILERATGRVFQGHVPPGSVVVSGNLPAKDGSHSLYCAVIVKQVDAQTRAKTSINELLRMD